MPFTPSIQAKWLKAGGAVEGSNSAEGVNPGYASDGTGYMNGPIKQLFDNTDWLAEQIEEVATSIAESMSFSTVVYLLGMKYPVGTSYVNFDNGTNPGILLGHCSLDPLDPSNATKAGCETNGGTWIPFGTWTTAGEGRVMIGHGTATDVNGLSRNFSASANSSGQGKWFQFTVLTGTGGSAARIVVDGNSINIPSSQTASQVAALVAAYDFENLSVSYLVDATNLGAVVTLKYATSAGNLSAPTISATGSITVGSVTADGGHPYIAPVYGKTGGEFTHKLLPIEGPRHKHVMGTFANNGGVVGATSDQATGVGGAERSTDFSTGGAAHNIVQPWITVYMWKRIG